MNDQLITTLLQILSSTLFSLVKVTTKSMLENLQINDYCKCNWNYKDKIFQKLDIAFAI